MKKQYEEPKAEVVKMDAVYAGNGNGNKNSNNKNTGHGKANGHTSAYGKGNNDKWD